MRRLTRLLSLLSIALLCGATSASALTLYGVEKDSFGSRNAFLYTINEGTGVATAVGATGITTLTSARGLAWDGTGLLTIGFETTSGNFNLALARISTSTGAASVIANLSGTALSGTVKDVSFDGVNTLWVATVSGVYTVNATTGATALIGSHGAILSSGLGMAFDGGGVLRMVNDNDIGSVNQGTGAYTAGTDLGALGGDCPRIEQADALGTTVFAFIRREGGTGAGCTPPTLPQTEQLVRINDVSGTPALVTGATVSGTADDLVGLAVVLPEPGLAPLLGFAGLFLVLRRRRG